MEKEDIATNKLNRNKLLHLFLPRQTALNHWHKCRTDGYKRTGNNTGIIGLESFKKKITFNLMLSVIYFPFLGTNEQGKSNTVMPFKSNLFCPDYCTKLMRALTFVVWWYMTGDFCWMCAHWMNENTNAHLLACKYAKCKCLFLWICINTCLHFVSDLISTMERRKNTHPLFFLNCHLY